LPDHRQNKSLQNTRSGTVTRHTEHIVEFPKNTRCGQSHISEPHFLDKYGIIYLSIRKSFAQVNVNKEIKTVDISFEG